MSTEQEVSERLELLEESIERRLERLLERLHAVEQDLDSKVRDIEYQIDRLIVKANDLERRVERGY